MPKTPLESIVEYAYEEAAVHDVLDIVENAPWYDGRHFGVQFQWSVRNGVWPFVSGEIAARTWVEVNG